MQLGSQALQENNNNFSTLMTNLRKAKYYLIYSQLVNNGILMTSKGASRTIGGSFKPIRNIPVYELNRNFLKRIQVENHCF